MFASPSISPPILLLTYFTSSGLQINVHYEIPSLNLPWKFPQRKLQLSGSRKLLITNVFQTSSPDRLNHPENAEALLKNVQRLITNHTMSRNCYPSSHPAPVVIKYWTSKEARSLKQDTLTNKQRNKAGYGGSSVWNHVIRDFLFAFPLRTLEDLAPPRSQRGPGTCELALIKGVSIIANVRRRKRNGAV